MLVELGSGSSVKTRILIREFVRRQGRLRYVPVDISPTALGNSARQLLEDFPELEITGLAAEYQNGLDHLLKTEDHPRLVLWLGSNIGNFERPAAADFLRGIRTAMADRDQLLVGIDLRKDATILQRAYDDSQGVTARFNLNILAHINRELGGRFELDRFSHRATYDEEAGRIAMFLVSEVEQVVAIDALGMEVQLAAGEAIHTEHAYKYSRQEIADTCAAAALRLERHLVDAAGRFSLNLLGPA